MQQSRFLFMLSAIVLIFMVLWMSVFIVYPRQQVAIKRFGQIVKVESDPGIYLKVPFVDKRIVVDNRLLRYDVPTQSVQVRGGAYYEVDAFFIYRITDPKLFLQRIASGRPQIAARENLAPRFIDALRAVYGKREFKAALSDERGAMMAEVQRQFSVDAGSLGITIVDVRIRKTDLTDAVSEDVYRQMAAEREAVAENIRARGQQERDRIVAEANREYEEIVAAAKRDAEITRGEGQAESIRLLLKAREANPSFYDFWLAMEQYKNLEHTPMVISPNEDFFFYFRNLLQAREKLSSTMNTNGNTGLNKTVSKFGGE
ncbi:protease modulator HflC [Bartonella henselae]|uniref:Protein HflC n=1 Tax=Bartonella henselae (strain ATCC 49882 / DSM 28221 / CCUG 30454 / Houston 1) TaxID=283166 RepID=A0A0H3LX60_BARHE|nr:protease modulator HflC [Bartonella henselae]ATP13155.1 protease modulator HflC [Bartonella henselae]MDM9983023.1 protease modulator HflC [Bartonella henselae]MDM9984593.1 protease modulator HflC [Bartonella henselae]MDM9985877.1 protease modulator HflC [Bartonella henselae]MDM9987610.1 protease modulator HflC [Bartonella henselae]